MSEELKSVDVLIIGAGLSGIGGACQLRRNCPERSFMIFESRAASGGTWDLFRYPGIRSDSDMYTFSYGFKPWRDPSAIADGAKILNYIRETAAEYDVERHIEYHRKVVSARWSSFEKRWTVTAECGDTGESVTVSCQFIFSCSGYYDYEQGYTPEFVGLNDFSGTVVHPQQWPEDLDYKGKRVVVIGSGATAMTLVPNMTQRAEKVTMVQRSPPTWYRDRRLIGLPISCAPLCRRVGRTAWFASETHSGSSSFITRHEPTPIAWHKR